MDEMTVLREAGTLLDPPTTQPPAALRRRVLEALEADTPAPVPTLQLVGSGGDGPSPEGRGTGRGHRPGRDRSDRRQFGSKVAVAAGIAAVTAGALAIAPTVGDEPAASAEAVEILESAAAKAAQEPAWEPRPDQFVYTRGVQRASSEGEGPDGEYYIAMVTSTREAWNSVDARRTGLVRGVSLPSDDPTNPGGGSWESELEPCDGTWDACGDIPAFPPGMPTDGDADTMLAFLRDTVEPYEARDDAPAELPDQAVFDAAVELLSQGGMPPEIVAGLLGAVAQIPEVTEAGELTDVTGRVGVGVGLTSTGGLRQDIIIDPDTDQVLGTRSDYPGAPEPSGWALLESGVVDAVGDTP